MIIRLNDAIRIVPYAFITLAILSSPFYSVAINLMKASLPSGVHFVCTGIFKNCHKIHVNFFFEGYPSHYLCSVPDVSAGRILAVCMFSRASLEQDVSFSMI